MANFLEVPILSTTQPSQNAVNNYGIDAYFGKMGGYGNGNNKLYVCKISTGTYVSAFFSYSSGLHVITYYGSYLGANVSVSSIDTAQGKPDVYYYYTGSDSTYLYPNASYGLNSFPNFSSALLAFRNEIILGYPIHYTRTGCTLTAPADAAPGQDCVVIVNPSEGYTFKGSSGVRIQDSSGANVPFIVSGNRISFTYPQPI